MATFTVASLAFDNAGSYRGQGITPNVAGPDGTGSPGSATSVNLTDFTLGYGTSSTSGRAGVAYLYDTLPTLSNLNSGIGAIATSSSTTDGNDFGAGSYTRKFHFSGNLSLDPTKVYYVLFPSNQSARYKNPAVYTGGDAYSSTLADTGRNLQFSADFTC
ncbi:MAG: hypothetical protein WCI73_06155 [Phycisphaerae bacterium]